MGVRADLRALELAALLLHKVVLELCRLQLHILAPVPNFDLALVALEALHLLASVKKLHSVQPVAVVVQSRFFSLLSKSQRPEKCLPARERVHELVDCI